MNGGSTRTSHPETGVAFYEQAGRSSAIMSLCNMSDGILPQLQMETLAVYAAATRGCTALVELGCYDGRALEVARFAGLQYVGADIDRDAIELLGERIRKEGLAGSACTLVDDVLSHQLWDRSLLGSWPLYVVPFNLLGNFERPDQFLRSLASVEGIAVVSVFNGSPEACVARHAYYARCGITSLRSTPTPDGGVLFDGDNGFHSRSYSEEGFRRVLAESGTSLVELRRNMLGFCATVVLNTPEIVPSEAGGSGQPWARSENRL